MLKENLESFIQPVYSKTRRSFDTYDSLRKRCTLKITELAQEYRTIEHDAQALREIRNEIDYYLRRYHNYAIKENIGAHYVEVGLKGNGIFEHMIPASTVRDCVLAGKISVEQALNVPTCRLSKDSDNLLREKGWANNTPDVYNFWLRYSYCFESVFKTHDGHPVDTNMNLDDHYKLFTFI